MTLDHLTDDQKKLFDLVVNNLRNTDVDTSEGVDFRLTFNAAPEDKTLFAADLTAVEVAAKQELGYPVNLKYTVAPEKEASHHPEGLSYAGYKVAAGVALIFGLGLLGTSTTGCKKGNDPAPRVDTVRDTVHTVDTFNHYIDPNGDSVTVKDGDTTIKANSTAFSGDHMEFYADPAGNSSTLNRVNQYTRGKVEVGYYAMPLTTGTTSVTTPRPNNSRARVSSGHIEPTNEVQGQVRAVLNGIPNAILTQSAYTDVMPDYRIPAVREAMKNFTIANGDPATGLNGAMMTHLDQYTYLSNSGSSAGQLNDPSLLNGYLDYMEAVATALHAKNEKIEVQTNFYASNNVPNALSRVMHAADEVTMRLTYPFTNDKAFITSRLQAAVAAAGKNIDVNVSVTVTDNSPNAIRQIGAELKEMGTNARYSPDGKNYYAPKFHIYLAKDGQFLNPTDLDANRQINDFVFHGDVKDVKWHNPANGKFDLSTSEAGLDHLVAATPGNTVGAAKHEETLVAGEEKSRA